MKKWFIAGLIAVFFTFASADELITGSIVTTNTTATNVLLGAVVQGSASNLASGAVSHAEGFGTEASGTASHAEGIATVASGEYSHAEGVGTVAGGYAAHAAGTYAHTTNDYTYVWSDGTAVSSTTSNQFTVHAQNGIRLLGGPVEGDGGDLTNLTASHIVGRIPASSLPTSGVWNASGVTITNASLAGNVTVSSLTVATNLTVQGIISGNGSGLTGVTAGAGGSDGSFQFNNNGVLSGDTNFFIHPTEHKPAFRSPSGNFFRGYNSETISDNNLIYSVRNENGISVLRLRENGQDTIRLSGDGTAYIKGNLQLDGQLIADGSGLTNLSVQAQVDALITAVSNSPAATITTNDIASWNSGGNLAAGIQIPSNGVVAVTTNLTVQGVITGDGSGITNLTVDTDGDGMPDWYENQHRGKVIFEDHFNDGTLDPAWVMKRTYWEETDGKLKTVPEVLPDFNYGHSGNGRGSLIVLHEGDTNWVDYSFEFTCAGVGVVQELNPHGLPVGLIGPLSSSFRVQEAPASWNDPATTLYEFEMTVSEWGGASWTNGGWRFSAVSNYYIPGSDYYGMTADGGMAAALSTETEKSSLYEGVITGSTNDLMISSSYESKAALVSGEDMMTLSSETGTGWSPYHEGEVVDLTNGNSTAINLGTQENHVRVVVKGTRMYVWVNGVFLGEAADSSGIATYGGIALHGGAWEAMAWYDDVVVRSVGLDPNVPDADLDYDNDGFTNLEEYQRDTDPMAPDTVAWSELTGIPADLADGHIAWSELTGTPILNASDITGTLSVASLPTSGVWNASGITVTNATLTGNVTVSSLTVATNLTVQGTISGNGSGLTGVTASAGGNNGELQFNNNGTLAGNTNFFLHPVEKKLAFRSPSGNIFRAYNSETISDNNLIYSLRNENGTSVLRLRQNGQDTLRLSGDGSAEVASLTLGGVTYTNWPSGGGTVTNELDPHFTDWLGTDAIANWNAAYGWGNHSEAGYADAEAVSIQALGVNDRVTAIEIGTNNWNNAYFMATNNAADIVGLANNLGLVTLDVSNHDSRITTLELQTNHYLTVADAVSFANTEAATNTFSGELVARTNLTVQGAFVALYLPPQGDLLMGSYTNELSQ